MKRLICAMLCIAMLAGLVPTFATAAELPFTDVTAGWYYKAVEWCYGKGYMSGTSATTFSPEMTLTRAMTVTVLRRVAGSPEPEKGALPFADVGAGRWYAKSVLWAYQNGYAAGISDTEFAPNAPVTREQLAAFLYTYASKNNCDVSAREPLDKYSDGSLVSGWAKDAVSWAIASGVISGYVMETGGRSVSLIKPVDSATRAELAVMIKKFVENVVEAEPAEHVHTWDDGEVTERPTILSRMSNVISCHPKIYL